MSALAHQWSRDIDSGTAATRKSPLVNERHFSVLRVKIATEVAYSRRQSGENEELAEMCFSFVVGSK